MRLHAVTSVYKFIGEQRGDLLSHFKTALPYRRTEKHAHFLGCRAKFNHLFERIYRYPGKRATPAGMHGPDYTCVLVKKHECHTVGRVDPDNDIRQPRHDSIVAIGRLLILSGD